MLQEQTEIELLKERAVTLGVSFHPSIGTAKLKAKIAEALGEEPEATPVPEAKKSNTEVATKENPGSVPVETRNEKQSRLRKEATKLIRVRITCMNPNKKEWEGEYFTVSNSSVGTIKKYVPFDNDAGWMVPKIILNMIQERKCQVFFTKKAANGIKMRQGKLIKEFAVEVLTPLTREELGELADRQAQANSID